MVNNKGHVNFYAPVFVLFIIQYSPFTTQTNN